MTKTQLDIIRDPPVLHPNTVLTLASARALLGLSKSGLQREIRLGRLRCSKRAGKCWILGAWLLEWLASGEVVRGGD